MRSSFKFILCLISADIIIIAILFLCGLTGIFPNNAVHHKNSDKTVKNTTSGLPESTSGDSEPDDTKEHGTYAEETTSAKAIEHFYVLNSTSKVYIREEASTNGKILAELPPASYGEVINTEGSWTKVSFNSTEGYIFSEYIVTGDSAEEMIKQIGTPKVIIDKSCNIRNVPDMKSPVIGTAPAGTIYNYNEALSDETWYAIIMPDGSISYISSGYASKTDF